MSTSKVRDTIATAFAALERASDEGIDAAQMFRKAYDAALTGERQHRRAGSGLGNRYKQSAETAARYFVVKWFVEPAKIASAREAGLVRLDCLYASALRGELNDRMGRELAALLPKLAPVVAIDYLTDLVGA